jgi:hypothetical protein
LKEPREFSCMDTHFISDVLEDLNGQLVIR